MQVGNAVAISGADLRTEPLVRAWDRPVGCTPLFEEHKVSPYVQIYMLLQGEQRFMLDGKLFELDSLQGTRPIAGIFCITRPCVLKFLAGADGPTRKVKISAPLSWVRALARGEGDDATELGRFFARHLSHYSFPMPSNMIAIAEQVLKPPPTLARELIALYRQSRGLEIMRLICGSLIDSNGWHRAPAAGAAVRQSERVRDYILSHLAETLTITQIARATGASASAVQRRFRRHFGMTIFEFIREKRLELARDALERDGASVAQAAFVAGYAHASNFTAAFKKAYGKTPRFKRG